MPITAPTNVGKVPVKYYDAYSLFNKGNGFMNSFDFTCNPYRGCTFSCSYCYARYFNNDANKIDNWGNWLEVKRNAIEIMKNMKVGALNDKTIYLSSATDPYQPVEQKLNLTRSILYYMAMHHQPKLVVQTRAPLVTRDIDMLQHIPRTGGQVQVNITITTDHDKYRRYFEPGCPSIPARLRAVRELVNAGIQTCVTMTPLLVCYRIDDMVKYLKDTGCQRFIVQPFHMNNYGKEKVTMMGQTSEKAITKMCKILDCQESSFQQKYGITYKYYETILKENFPNIGVGKQGFRPPF